MILASGQGPTGAWLTCAAAQGFCPPLYRCSRRAPATLASGVPELCMHATAAATWRLPRWASSADCHLDAGSFEDSVVRQRLVDGLGALAGISPCLCYDLPEVCAGA